ncbi:hypothetical protein [Prevotella sp. E13-27]|uniref:hypothetical protein n=1 Tax=Prevotella sp. E13-27 TaxID=2938122 RepID=UPI00200AF55F|nr:hypothetical protein [Prevotella sp. E13-27]MCK8621456.1 hypothetical protein [Prevotella sp. E13-27]
MKKLLLSIVLLLSVANLQAQSISHIETTKNWYYIYDQDGKKIKTLSSTIGELQGFSASFFVVKSSSWYYIYDANGKKKKTLSESTVGKVLSVSGETFTSQVGSWIYTWSKEGKKISTRSAHQ